MLSKPHQQRPKLGSPLALLSRFIMRNIRRLIFTTGLLVWLSAALIAAYGYQLQQSLPKESRLSFPAIRAHAESVLVVNSIDSSINNSIQWISLNQVNRDLLNAIVLSEDDRFFIHDGINYDALLTALIDNMKSQQWRFGDDTISQQVANALYLSGNHNLTKKLQQLLITQRLEQALSKNQILELYLNTIELGPGLFGIGNASQYYFNKEASKVNAAEGAYLALLIPSVRKYHYSLYQNGNWSPALKKKHQRILREMRHKKLISQREFKQHAKWVYEKNAYL